MWFVRRRVQLAVWEFSFTLQRRTLVKGYWKGEYLLNEIPTWNVYHLILLFVSRRRLSELLLLCATKASRFEILIGDFNCKPEASFVAANIGLANLPPPRRKQSFSEQTFAQEDKREEESGNIRGPLKNTSSSIAAAIMRCWRALNRSISINNRHSKLKFQSGGFINGNYYSINNLQS